MFALSKYSPRIKSRCIVNAFYLNSLLMATNNTNTTRLLARFFAGGILLSMVTVFLLHYFGTWEQGTERPDAETTASVIVTNKCAVLGDTHILRPGSSITANESNKELKLAGS